MLSGKLVVSGVPVSARCYGEKRGVVFKTRVMTSKSETRKVGCIFCGNDRAPAALTCGLGCIGQALVRRA